MATEVTQSQLDGNFKRVYGDYEDAIAKFAMIAGTIPFRRKQRIGDSFRFPVLVNREHGVAFAGGSAAGDAFALATPDATGTKEANVSGAAQVMRARLSYGAVSRAAESGSLRSFVAATRLTVTSLMESSQFYRELQLIYGKRGIAQISAVSGSGTTRTWTITDATFAPGVWSQMVRAPLDVYDDEVLTNQQNSNALVRVTGVDVANKQVVVSGNSADLTEIAANDWICPDGWDGQSMDGIIQILANTGTIFGIDAASYPVWKAPTTAVGSKQLTMGTVQKGLVNAVGQGLTDDVDLHVGVAVFGGLNTDHAALRRFAESTKTKMDLGTRGVEYHGANGTTKIVTNPMLYESRSFGLVKSLWRRIGSSDVTFRLPNYPGQDRFFRELPDNAGFEIRTWMDQGVICTCPAKQPYFTGITPDLQP